MHDQLHLVTATAARPPYNLASLSSGSATGSHFEMEVLRAEQRARELASQDSGWQISVGSQTEASGTAPARHAEPDAELSLLPIGRAAAAPGQYVVGCQTDVSHFIPYDTVSNKLRQLGRASPDRQLKGSEFRLWDELRASAP